MSNKLIAMIAAAALTLGGMAVTWALPAFAAGDMWFAAYEGLLVPGFGVGLLLALLGTSFALPYFSPTRRKIRH